MKQTSVLEGLRLSASITSICMPHKHLPSFRGTEIRVSKLFKSCKQAVVIFHVCTYRSSFEEDCTFALK